ncbi:unnamed protein product, partial [Brachionus calyciflorus]
AEKKSLLTKIFKKKTEVDNETKTNLQSSTSLTNIIPQSDLSKFYFTYDYENGTGELYMRVGIAIFSLCSMIDRSLSFVQMIEAYLNNPSILNDCKEIFILSLISKITSLLFIFIQTFFIFKYANIVINFGKNSAVLGLIHIVSTNFCVFFRTVVRETVEEIKHHHYPIVHGSKVHLIQDQHEESVHLTNTTMHPMKQLGCFKSVFFTSDISVGIIEAQERIGPYLYPCVIEYSLMCLTVFYILWSSIEQRYSENNRYGQWAIGNDEKTRVLNNQSKLQEQAHRFASFAHEKRHVNQFVIDCGKSTTGLFLGIFVLLFTLITLIVYFIYKNGNTNKAVQISEMTELLLVSLSFIIVISLLIKFKMAKFNYKPIFEMGYNETLTIVGLAGIYLFGFYSIIAILENGINSRIEMLSLSIQIASIVEATLQSVLIIEGLKMFTKDRFIKKDKPGRSMLTLLILLDVSLWLSETFSVKKYEMNTIQLDYYDIVFWSIVSSVSSPLAIFFRFHASVCLSDMWKTLYE